MFQSTREKQGGARGSRQNEVRVKRRRRRSCGGEDRGWRTSRKTGARLSPATRGVPGTREVRVRVA
jgi:hypothetical protein